MLPLASFLDELTKIAATRAVKEWRAASGAGDTGTAGQIAQASGQLGLKPRYLENISGGGMEAGVDKMMGSAAASGLGQGQTAQLNAPNESGYIARKIYKPDSPLSTGESTTKLLGMKQQYTDAARSLSPEAKQMVPAMYGHKTIEGPGGQLRHISEHEYVQGGQSLSRSANPVAHAQRVQDVVANPMAERGMGMGDIARSTHGQLAGNASNVMVTPQGPKVIDFLPVSPDSPVGVVQSHQHDMAIPAASSSGLGDTGYGKHNMGELRKEVYRPSANYVHPEVKSKLQALSQPVSGIRPAGGATAMTTPVARSAGTAVATPAARSASGGALGVAKTMMSPTAHPPPMSGALHAVEGRLNPARAAGMMGKFKPMGSTLLHAAHI